MKFNYIVENIGYQETRDSLKSLVQQDLIKHNLPLELAEAIDVYLGGDPSGLCVCPGCAEFINTVKHKGLLSTLEFDTIDAERYLKEKENESERVD